MVTRDDWVDQVAGRRPDRAELRLVAPLQDSHNGGSGAFLARASDSRRYWIKPLNNLQGERMLIAEQIVGRVGALVGAPVCDVRTVQITDDHQGWVFRESAALIPGIAHGSLHVGDCLETRGLSSRSRDDNRRRHCAIMALYDWCWGDDFQWLVLQDGQDSYVSHDHGWYFPGGANWTVDSLIQSLDQPRLLGDPNGGFDMLTVSEVAQRFGSITRRQIADCLSKVPQTWPVTDEELEAIGLFLEHRAGAVGTRLRQRFGGLG